LGPFKGTTWALPYLNTQIAGIPVGVNVRYDNELCIKNRLDGQSWFVTLTAVFPKKITSNSPKLLFAASKEILGWDCETTVRATKTPKVGGGWASPPCGCFPALMPALPDRFH
jgi:hypothetical protein